MISFNKQDIAKTALIVWLVGTTGYVLYDQYMGFKVRGLQQAYKSGYEKSVDDLIQKVEGSNCQPFEVKKDDKDIKLVESGCQNAPAVFSDGNSQLPSASPVVNQSSK